MSLHGALKTAISLLPVAIALVFMSNVGPTRADGTIHQTNILIGSLLIGAALFSFVRLVLQLFISVKRASHIAAATAFTGVQLLLLSSISLVTPAALFALAAFNTIVYWYITRRINGQL